MKIKCNHFNGNNTTFTCPTCKEYYRCTLIQPSSPTHQTLLKEINYWLNELKNAKRRIKQYKNILNDIQNHKYSYTVNVYGNIQYAPKQNVFNVFIKRPEHVMYSWNLNKLNNAKDEIIENIRGLRVEELKLRKEVLDHD